MLSHVDARNRPAMVDVGGKAVTRRTARARALVQLTAEAATLFVDGELRSKKGPVLQTACLAGMMAAKRTHELIPLCHPLPLDNCQVDARLDDNGVIVIDSTASAEARTGVEMEALTAASVAALTVYDMVKALGLGTVIREIGLIEKTGGKSDFRAGGNTARTTRTARARGALGDGGTPGAAVPGPRPTQAEACGSGIEPGAITSSPTFRTRRARR